MKLACLSFACAAAVLASSPGHAQEPPSAAVPGVTVTAPANLTPAQRVERFGQVDNKGRLARWYAPVCPAVAGLPEAFDGFIAQRIRGVAAQAGAPVAGDRCQANAIVLITPGADAFVQRLVKQRAAALAGGRWSIDKASLHAFADGPGPVRWIFLSDTAPIVGLTVNSAGTPQAAAALGSGELEQMFRTAGGGPPMYGSVVPSRLTPAGDESVSQVVIVVDAKRIAGLSAGQVADYLSMVALAHVRADSTFPATDTVLNLFAPNLNDASRPAGLRPWDSAFLAALYRSDSQASYTAQVSHIAQRVAGELGPNAVDVPAK